MHSTQRLRGAHVLQLHSNRVAPSQRAPSNECHGATNGGARARNTVTNALRIVLKDARPPERLVVLVLHWKSRPLLFDARGRHNGVRRCFAQLTSKCVR